MTVHLNNPGTAIVLGREFKSVKKDAICMSGKEYYIRELGFIAKLYSMCKLQLFIVQ